MRALDTVWLIVGDLRKIVESERPIPWSNGDQRSVLLESSTFPSEETAKEALLYNWSRNPHEARVLAIQTFDMKHTVILSG
jgi:hypothetical protein